MLMAFRNSIFLISRSDKSLPRDLLPMKWILLLPAALMYHSNSHQCGKFKQKKYAWQALKSYSRRPHRKFLNCLGFLKKLKFQKNNFCSYFRGNLTAKFWGKHHFLRIEKFEPQCKTGVWEKSFPIVGVQATCGIP